MADSKSKYKWTQEDNRVAETELDIANYLTRQLKQKPELSLNTLLVSKNVQHEVGGALAKLELQTGKRLRSQVETTRNADGSRRVWVTILPEQEA